MYIGATKYLENAIEYTDKLDLYVEEKESPCL